MNYHIIIQENFFRSYIEDIYRIHQEDNNIFWVRGCEGENAYFRTDRKVDYVPNSLDALCEKLRTLKSDDKLFVAWYDILVGMAILKSKVDNPLYVYTMGADVYGEPEWYHEHWLLDSMTKWKMYHTYLFPQFVPINKPWRWYRIVNVFGFLYRLRQQYKLKLKTMKRIDYIVLPEHALSAMQIVKRLYPSLRAKHVYGTFDQNFDLANTLKQRDVCKQGDTIKILLGNSADPLGNHLDAINFIKKNVKVPYDLYCFLSYGDSKSKDWTIKYGVKTLGAHFHPIINFMDRNEFVDFINTMDMIVMFHNRSQAAGTTMTALTLGKPVFLKQGTSLASLMHNIGVSSVYDVMCMGKINLYKAIDLACKNRENTIEKIAQEYSDNTRLVHLKKLLV